MRPKLEPILYGASYYHEYMPYERLVQDIALMKDAGMSVVRVGESTWSLWEPEDGAFEHAWMDRVVDAMHQAGIKVIMGTPPTRSRLRCIASNLKSLPGKLRGVVSHLRACKEHVWKDRSSIGGNFTRFRSSAGFRSVQRDHVGRV
jgi:glycosyl hydrolase family 42 (putative beta-galactosidase)